MARRDTTLTLTPRSRARAEVSDKTIGQHHPLQPRRDVCVVQGWNRIRIVERARGHIDQIRNLGGLERQRGPATRTECPLPVMRRSKRSRLTRRDLEVGFLHGKPRHTGSPTRASTDRAMTDRLVRDRIAAGITDESTQTASSNHADLRPSVCVTRRHSRSRANRAVRARPRSMKSAAPSPRHRCDVTCERAQSGFRAESFHVGRRAVEAVSLPVARGPLRKAP